MKTRVITGAVLALIFIPVFVIGGIPLDIILLLLSMGATYEIVTMFNRKSAVPSYIIIHEVVCSGIVFFLFAYFLQGYLDVEYLLYMIMLLLIMGAILTVFEERYSTADLSNMLLAILYPAFGFAAISALRFMGLEIIGFLFLITIATDIFAYIIGINFGKHRLAVKISPKKSIEGSIGGTFFALIFTLIYVYAFDMTTIGNISFTIVTWVLVVLVLSIVGQIGDLIASKFKRDYDVKDYSNLFPGHGGVMDRFDSVLFAAMILVFISEVVGLL